jgi:hypothetical protein
MGKELEPKTGAGTAPDVYRDRFAARRAETEPAQVEPSWYQPVQLTERPEWTELRPPYNPDSKMEQVWSAWLTPLRFLALGFLWVTFAWYRTAVALGSIFAVYVLIFSK